MPRVTNQKLAEDLAFLKGKVLSAEENAKEHRSWEISQMDKIEGYLKEQNGRLRTAEVQIGWFKGLAAMFSIVIGYIFKRTI